MLWVGLDGKERNYLANIFEQKLVLTYLTRMLVMSNLYSLSWLIRMRSSKSFAADES